MAKVTLRLERSSLQEQETRDNFLRGEGKEMVPEPPCLKSCWTRTQMKPASRSTQLIAGGIGVPFVVDGALGRGVEMVGF
jgi:hypothetical protein